MQYDEPDFLFYNKNGEALVCRTCKRVQQDMIMTRYMETIMGLVYLPGILVGNTSRFQTMVV